MARADGSGFCGLAQGFLVSRSPPSGRAESSWGGRVGPAREVVVISSDDDDDDDEEEEEEDGSAPMARKLRFGEEGPTGGRNLVVVKKGKSDGEDEEDDCVVLDRDPDGPVAVGGQEGSVGFDGSLGLDELLIVAEKGQVACRDFPHSRHLCSNLPFATTPHVRHCTMCYCFVCDAPAPCSYWGKGLSADDHCHGTDDEMSWKILRQTFRLGRLTASLSDKYQNVVHPPTAPPRQQDIQCQVSAPQSHPSSIPGKTVGAVRASPLTRAERSRDNAHNARITLPVTPCRQETYQEEEEGEECTSKVYVGNLHYDIVSEDLAKLFEQAGVVDFSEVIYSRGTGQSRGYGFVTMSTVNEAELAVEMFNGVILEGRALRVEVAKERPRRGLY